MQPSSDVAGAMTGTLELRPPRHRVSPRAIWYWTTRAAVGWAFLLGGETIWLMVDAERRGTALLVLAVTIVVAAAHLAVMPQWRYRVHRWEVTPEAVYTQAGWLNQERRIAPISRIQTVDSQRGLYELLFRLANVTITTASAAGPLRINGLDQDAAQRLVDDLTATTAATEGDAT